LQSKDKDLQILSRNMEAEKFIIIMVQIIGCITDLNI